ncbi:MAG: hypothetical protein LBB91_11310 [Clostridiales bacterium]|nr:hypothetical protein [Clostridiales bacterium]
MKKILVIMLALCLCWSLAACGGGGTATDGGASGSDNNTVPQTSTPDPEPAPAAMKTVSIDHEDYGGISVSYPDDGSVTLEQYGYDDGVEIVGTVDRQLAQLTGNGFHIILGYMNYSSGGYEGYKEYTFEYNKRAKPAEVSYGGTDGYSWVNENYPALFLAFPASGTWSRMIALTSDNITKDMGMSDIAEKLTGLLESKPVQDILGTLDFTAAALTGDAADPAKTGLIDGGYIKFTCANGWYVNNVLEGSARISGDTFYVMQEGKSGVINISSMINNVPKERVESLLNSSTANAKRLDNLTVNGVEYLVLEMEHNGYKDYQYLTSIGGFDENKNGTISILIQGFTPDEAKPLLETITIGDSF